MSVELFRERLKQYLKRDVELVVNENRSTMLNLLEKNSSSVRLSVHRIFLDAPEYVISAIAHYVRGTRMQSSILRHYIQQKLSKCDYSHLVKSQQLTTDGNYYNLKEVYETLNQKYFSDALDLSITWYGRPKLKSRTRITFGQYLSGLRLIKIHRILDDPFFPDYFVHFVIYHEMLHSVIAGSLDRRGRYCFHDRSFKEREKAFEHYNKAVAWEKNNKRVLFNLTS